MSGSGTLPDAADRLLAATAFDRNIVVEAGAGTGKTSLLVERLLVALGSGRAPLHRIAAITFTEKAAGEMRERLSDGLETLRAIAAGDDRPPGRPRGAEADRAYAWLRDSGSASDGEIGARALDALHGLDRATVTTVHGFCAEILRAHPFDAEVSPAFEIDRGERFAALFPSAWETFLARELGPGATRAALWSRVLGSWDLATVEEVARALSRSAIPASLLDGGAPWPDAHALFGAEAASLAARIDALLFAVPKMGYKARVWLDAALPRLRDLAEGDRGGAGAPPGSEILVGDAPGTNKTIPQVRVAEFKALVEDARSLLRPLGRVGDASLRDLVAAAAPFAKEFRETLTASGLVDFDGLLARSRDLLRRNPPVREAVRSRYAMLLVDEFQDTDPIQYEIVLHLAGRKGDDREDPFESDLEPGRLFIVGDPKQSVYRFRGADYAAYRRAVARVLGQGGLGLSLTANFRTFPSVLAPVNALFASPSEATWNPSPYQPDYLPIDPARADDDVRAGVELWTVLPAGAAASRRREAEGRLVARRIREIRAEERRPWKDFYILLRAFSDLSRYVRPLRDAGIPFVVAGGRTFHERTEVIRFLAHLRLLARPDDPPALLAWLRSPAGAVPDGELAAWAKERGAWDRSARPDAVRFPRLARALDALRALEERVRDLPLDELVLRTLASSHLSVLEGFAFEGAQRAANLRKLAARACDLARDGSLSLVQLVEALEERAGFEPEGESPLADENTDAVRLLTIHAAKGLEAPVVLVPDLAREDLRGRGHDAIELGVLQGPFGTALAVRTPDAVNAACVALDRDNLRHDEAESVRLLYVALTRARDRLVLLAGRSGRGRTSLWIDALAAWGYRAGQLPADGERLAEGLVEHRLLLEAPVEEALAPRAIVGAPSAVASHARAVAALSEAARRGPLRAPGGLSEDRESATGGAAGPARDPARAAGSAVHRLLEQWRPGESIGRVAVAAASRAAASERGCEPSEVEREVLAIVERFEETPFAALLAAATTVLREIPVLRLDENGVVWRGRADLVYRRPDGLWAVADYKTDADADATALAERYAPQIRVYALAVRDALGLAEAPRAELWPLRLGRIVEIPL